MGNFKLCFFASILLIAVAGCVRRYDDKATESLPIDILNREVNTNNDIVRFSPWPRKFREICKTYNIPCGIEEAIDDPIPGYEMEENVLSFGSQHVTIRQFLDKITALHPSYQWNYHAGVLNIIPLTGKEYEINNNVLMERQIKRLNIKNETPELAARHVCEYAGVILKEGPQEIVGFRKLIKTTPPQLSLEIRNMSVREVLNRIVKSDPEIGFWKFYYDARKNVGKYRFEYASCLD